MDLFDSVIELSKLNQNWYGVSPGYMKSREKKFWYSLPLEKVRFLNEKLRLF